MTMGRHTQDPVVSFYHFTPSSFIIEYLTEGEKMPHDSFYEVNPEKLSVWGHKRVGPPLPTTVQPIARARNERAAGERISVARLGPA